MESIRSGRTIGVLGRPAAVRRTLTAAAIVAVAVSAAVALEGQSDKAGLRGIIAKEVPGDLGPDAISALTGNWEAWGKGLSEQISKLYTDEKLDVVGQRNVLGQLRHRIQTMDKAIADPRYASLSDALITIRGRLARRVDVNAAILDTLELSPEQVKAKRVKRAAVAALRALDALEADLSRVPGGEAWLPYVHAEQLQQELAAGHADGLIPSVESKLNAADSHKTADQRRFLSRPAFGNLEKHLARLRKANETKASANPEAIRPKLTELVAAIEGYEDNGMSPDAEKLRQTLAEAEKAAIDEGDLIGRAVRRHYLNYNLDVVASDALISKLLADQEVTSGPVTDFVLGANVSGSETTTTDVSAGLQPSSDAAVIELVLNGTTQSSTVGATSEANIYTSGYHRWGAVKAIHYDGETITTEPARITYVQPSNTTTGASTRYSGMPIIGGIANRTAINEAEARRGQSEAIAAQRIETRVLPELDARVDHMIHDANRRLQNELKKRLDKAGVMPENIRARSNQSFLRIDAQIVGPNELSGDVVVPEAGKSAGLVINLHESLLNNAAQQLKLAGQTMTDAQVQQELERYLTLLSGQKIKIGGGNKKPAGDESQNGMLVFDKVDPIRFTIENGEIKLVIRTGFKQEGKEEIPVQEITVPLTLVVKGDKVVVQPGRIRAPGGAQFIRAGVIVKKLEQTIQPMPLDGLLHVQRPGRSEVNLAISDIRAINGWLTLWAN